MGIIKRVLGMSQQDDDYRRERERLAEELMTLVRSSCEQNEPDACPRCGSGLILQFGVRK